MDSSNQVIVSGTVIDHCQNTDCQDGNCPGCKNGNLWCDDPRCHPNCEDCPLNDNTFVTFLIVIFVIFGLLLLGFIIYAIWKGNRPDEINPHYTLESHPPSSQSIPVSSVNGDNPVSFVSSSPIIRPPTIVTSTSSINPVQSAPLSSSSMITGFERIPRP